MLPFAGEVAAFHRDTNVAIEVTGDADGSVGIGDVEVLIEPYAAVYWVEVAIPAVDIDPRVRIFGRALAGLRVHIRGRAEEAGSDCETRNQPLAECEHAATP